MRNPWLRGWFIVVGLTISSLSAYADKIDDYLKAQMEKRHIPGVSVAVVQDGKVVKAQGYGLANVELSVAATESTVYELASVTKQFTATGVMMLVEEGKLKLEDKITKLLPNLPPTWEGVTVKHLLNHTSGIKSYTSLPNFEKTLRKDFTKEELLKLILDAPLEFKPGEKWNYNNTGFFLLGMLIEKVSGKSYGEFLKERIFQPLGMTSTRVNSFQEIIKNRATGYTWAGTELHTAEYVSPTQPFSAGALVSTVQDMAKWDAALATTQLLKKSSLEQMWTATKLNDGKNADYGFGWAVETSHGHRLVQHGGGINGFSTQISRYRDDKLTLIVLTNSDNGNAGALAQGMAALYIPALAVAAEKPIEDKDAALTAKLKGVLLKAREGKADAELFTPEAQKELLPRIKEAKELFSSLGALKTFTLTGQKVEGKGKQLRYKAAFEKQSLAVSFFLTEDGKIGGIGVQQE